MASSNSQAPSIAGPLTAFQLFPKLPTELQNMVWRFAMEQPRVFQLVLRPWQFDSLYHPRPTSQVCQSARDECKRLEKKAKEEEDHST